MASPVNVNAQANPALSTAYGGNTITTGAGSSRTPGWLWIAGLAVVAVVAVVWLRRK